jgi:hypothetical protein
METEMEALLAELRGLKNNSSTIQNTRDIWEKIGNKDWAGAGFANEAEAAEWLQKNAYENLI